VLIVLAGGYFVFAGSNFYVENNAKEFVYIKNNQNFDCLVNNLNNRDLIKSNLSFRICARIFNAQKNMKIGAYAVRNGMNNYHFFKNITNGRQTPVNLKINNIRLKTQLASKISKQTNIDSLELINHLNDSVFLQKYGLNPYTAIALFIPNTYEVYWTLSIDELFDRMKKEYGVFWTDERRKKAAEIPLSPVEAAILASIVEEESNKSYEKPIIAGLYLNRLKTGMKLQADPTARFALGDFGITQVLNSYTRINSPYNTYIYKGLPPGPIRVPSAEGIDAVLNYDKNNYLFMCAKPEFNGEHNFAHSYTEHLKYQAAYHKAYREWKKEKEAKMTTK
jgi:UPF0755 protein